LSRADGKDELHLQGTDDASTILPAGETVNVRVLIKDGRTQDLNTIIDEPRPRVTLVSKNVEPGPTAAVVHLGSEDQLPQDGTLSFFLKSEIPAVFQRNEKIEVATADGLVTSTLTLDDGTLMLENAQSVLARLNPLKSFGASAFGHLQFRPVHADGRKGDWQPLVTLVRVPSLTDVRCVNTPEKQCTLIGTNLFLIDSVATKADFSDGVPVPLGITTTGIPIPHPTEPVLYLRLRDDPNVVSTATLPGISRLANSFANKRKTPEEPSN